MRKQIMKRREAGWRSLVVAGLASLVFGKNYSVPVFNASAHGNWQISNCRIIQALYRSIKTIQIRMQNYTFHNTPISRYIV